MSEATIDELQIEIESDGADAAQALETDGAISALVAGRPGSVVFRERGSGHGLC